MAVLLSTASSLCSKSSAKLGEECDHKERHISHHLLQPLCQLSKSDLMQHPDHDYHERPAATILMHAASLQCIRNIGSCLPMLSPHPAAARAQSPRPHAIRRRPLKCSLALANRGDAISSPSCTAQWGLMPMLPGKL